MNLAELKDDYELLSVDDLITLRKESGLKMQDMANLLDVHQNTYSSMEKSNKLSVINSMALSFLFQGINGHVYTPEKFKNITLLEFIEQVKGYKPDGIVKRLLFAIEAELNKS